MLRNTLTQTRHLITHISGKQSLLSHTTPQKPYILNFSASWCGPCKMMAPILTKKQEAAQGKWSLLKVDVDDEKNAELNEEFQVQGVPMFVFFRDGKEVGRVVGAMSEGKLDEAIKKIL